MVPIINFPESSSPLPGTCTICLKILYVQRYYGRNTSNLRSKFCNRPYGKTPLLSQTGREEIISFYLFIIPC